MLPEGWRNYKCGSDTDWFTNDGVKYANSIFVCKGSKTIECKLDVCLLDHLGLSDLGKNHPAFPGRGVFAKHFIPSESVIGFYAGILRPGGWAKDNPYVFAVEPVENDFVLDANDVGNITRFINDPVGSCFKANLVAEDVAIMTSGITIRCVQFRATCDILIGEELLYSYEQGREGYWHRDPELMEVIDLTGQETTIIKREKKDVVKKRDPESEKSGGSLKKHKNDREDNETLRLKPSRQFITAVSVPRNNDILTLKKGEKIRHLQMYGETTLIIQVGDSDIGSKDFENKEAAYDEFQAEVAILFFWGYNLIHTEPGQYTTLLGGGQIFN